MDTRKNILLVDDHQIMIEGMKFLLRKEPLYEVVAEANTGKQAIEQAKSSRPDLAVIDVKLPDMDGIEVTRAIRAELPETKILILSAYSEKDFISQALQAGANGYLLKDCVSEELLTSIASVLAGQRYLSPQIITILVEDYVENLDPEISSSVLDKLTLREKELLKVLVEGKTSKQAARDLHLSIKTVNARRREIMNKLEVNSMAELTKIAIREGLTNLEM